MSTLVFFVNTSPCTKTQQKYSRGNELSPPLLAACSKIIASKQQKVNNYSAAGIVWVKTRWTDDSENLSRCTHAKDVQKKKKKSINVVYNQLHTSSPYFFLFQNYNKLPQPVQTSTFRLKSFGKRVTWLWILTSPLIL